MRRALRRFPLWPSALLALLFAAPSHVVPAAAAASENAPLALLNASVAPGNTRRITLRFGESYAGDSLATPVLIAHGTAQGPTLCLTAAIHGDELNGVEVVRRVIRDIDPRVLRGSVIGVPVVNLLAFERSTRETPDRRDLNRYFPGRADGSFAARIAHRLFSDVIQPHCAYLVDFHTGSFNRANLAQLRADMSRPEVAALAAAFGTTPVLAKRGSSHMLRRVATEAGIPSVTFEFGETTTVQRAQVDYAVRALGVVLRRLGLLESGAVGATEPADIQPIYGLSLWVRAERGGIFIGSKTLGDEVASGEVIGRVLNPLTDEETLIRAPRDARILGLASNQFVLPGYGIFNLGVARSAPLQPAGK